MKANTLAFMTLCLAFPALASEGAAQAGPAGETARPVAETARPAAERPVPKSDVTLVYEREVYSYNGVGRRDPFRPLTDDDEFGPRFEQLALQGIIFATGQGRSVALLADGTGRIYRVRAGDVLGNARVVQIGTNRVVFAVDVFGTIRQETLELQRRGGVQR
jgi:hypothetical protein